MSDPSSGDDLTPLLSLMKSSKKILQFGASLSSEPSTFVGSIQFLVSCLYAMALLRHTFNELQNLHMRRYLFTKSNSYQLLLMGMYYLNYRHCFQMLTTPPKCKAWIESMVAMLCARWSQPISKIILGLTLERLVAWVICVVFKMIMKTLCILAFAMKSSGTVSIYT